MRIRAKLIVKNFELEDRRKKMGYTQDDFSEIIGMSINIYQQIELLRKKPTEDQAKSIALELNAPVSVLFPQGYEKLVDVFNKNFNSVIDYVPPLLEEDTERLLEQADAERTVLKLIEELPEKEKKLIEFRSGLNNGIEHTLDETGIKFGVTRERIRQIEAKAHERMRQEAKRLNITND